MKTPVRPLLCAHACLVCTFLLVAAAAFGGCDSDGDGSEPEPTPSPEAGGLELLAWDVFEETGAIEDGSMVPWVWGFQGGTMIRPKLVLPESTAVVEGDGVRVVLEHFAVDGERFEVEQDFQRTLFGEAAYRDAQGRLVIGPLDDQLAWTPVTGTVLTLTVTADLPEGEIVTTRKITLFDGNDMTEHPCDAFGEVAPTGCSYVPLPGEVEIVEIVDDTNTAGCNDPILVQGRFIPDEAQAGAIAACHVDSQAYEAEAFSDVRQTSHPTMERSCAEAAGVVVGGRLTAEFVVAVTGTCNPTPDLQWALPDFECACQ